MHLFFAFTWVPCKMLAVCGVLLLQVLWVALSLVVLLCPPLALVRTRHKVFPMTVMVLPDGCVCQVIHGRKQACRVIRRNELFTCAAG